MAAEYGLLAFAMVAAAVGVLFLGVALTGLLEQQATNAANAANGLEEPYDSSGPAPPVAQGRQPEAWCLDQTLDPTRQSFRAPPGGCPDGASAFYSVFPGTGYEGPWFCNDPEGNWLRQASGPYDDCSLQFPNVNGVVP